MFEIIASLLTGGATGVLGIGISKVFGFLERKQEHAQEVELRKLDAELAKIEAASVDRQQALEVEARVLEASYKAADRRWSTPGDSKLLLFVDFVRGMTRPFLTVLFVSLAGVFYFVSEDPATHERVEHTILYLATASSLWWFGTRPSKAEPGKTQR